jgi:hypothetical protein
MAGAMSEMILMIPMLMMMNKIDWKDEDNVFKVRIVYALSQVVIAGVLFLIYRKNEETTTSVHEFNRKNLSTKR